MSEKLKACPFCGEALTDEADIMDETPMCEGYYLVHHCFNGTEISTPSYDSRAEAIAAWNKRAETTTLRVIQTLAGTCEPHRMPIVLQQIHDLAKSTVEDEI